MSTARAAAPRFPRITLSPDANKRVSRGHRWIFSNEIAQRDPALANGGEAAVFNDKGEFLGSALYSAHALIAARIYSRASVRFDGEFIRRAIAGALALRSGTSAATGTGRVLFGDADFLPGIVADRYGDVLAVQLLTVGADQRRDMILDALEATLRPRAIVERSDAPVRAYEGLEPAVGLRRGSLDGPVAVTIHGVTFHADLLGGQKTGLFLDQADNWPLTHPYAKGARVLDLFCHVGGWGLSALAAGAASVTSVDESQPALDELRAAAVRSGLAADAVTTVCRDAFEWLRGTQDTFDVIVCDPPAFAKNRKQAADALRGYRDVNRLAMKRLRPGGLYVACSCSHHVGREDFTEMLRLAARDAGRQFRVLPNGGQPHDHAPLLALPETEYLKVSLLRDMRDPGFAAE